MKKADNFDPSKWLVENKITFQSRLNENEEESEIIKFLKSNKQELIDQIAKRFDSNEKEIEKYNSTKIVMGGTVDGDFDPEIAGFGEGLDLSFDPSKVEDQFGDAYNFTLTIAGKPVYAIAYNL